MQPCRGRGPGFLSADKCKISFLSVGGRAWLLPSEQQEGSGQLPGPHPLPCPLNCGKPRPRRPEDSRPGLPPQSPGQQICDRTPCGSGRAAGRGAGRERRRKKKSVSNLLASGDRKTYLKMAYEKAKGRGVFHGSIHARRRSSAFVLYFSAPLPSVLAPCSGKARDCAP